MIVLKSFSDTKAVVTFKNSITTRTNPWITGLYRPNGLYSKIKNNRITILDVENDYSLRGFNLNVYFYGLFIHIGRKNFLFGHIGPPMLFSAFILLVLICPFEYLHIRIMVLLFWAIVYLKDINKINYLREFVIK